MKKLLILILFAFPSFGSNLTAKTDYSLPAGSFDTIFVWYNVQLTVPGKTTVKTFVPVSGSALKVSVLSSGDLTLSDRLKPANNATIINEGLLTSQDVILTGTMLYLQNKGTHLVKGNLELGGKNVTYKVSGRTIVEGNLNLNGGNLSMEGCSSVDARGLNLNGTELVTGTGLIKVATGLNLSGVLTSSKDIKLCYQGNPPNPLALGAATRGCLNNCESGVSYEGLTFSQTDPETVSVSFTLKEVSGLKQMNVEYSLDGVSWKNVLIILPEKVSIGVKYVGSFKIQ